MGTRVNLRDEIESVLRSWNRHEIERKAPPIVDFDCHPPARVNSAKFDRIQVREQLVGLLEVASNDSATQHLHDRVSAAITYLDALVGERMPIREYIKATQGCDAEGWSDSYIAKVRDTAIQHLDRVGVTWGPSTMDDLTNAEVVLDPAAAPEVIKHYAKALEENVRGLANTDAPFNLRIEHVDIDAYWSYWLDGEKSDVRMRINSRRATFTDVQARQFALHEILGHGLQCASFSQICQQVDVPWVRITSVHAQQQVLLEGLAQALPLFVAPEDEALVARVRFAHYVELVRAKLHLAINDGHGVQECVRLARTLAPFWTDDAISDALSDRGSNPLLRTYLWAYPAGIDWFVHLADEGSEDTARTVIQAAYRSPLTPNELASLWPEGPTVGGDGA